MLFIFKKKKIVFDAYTHNPAAANLFPITSSKRHVPDWFKKLPSEENIEIDPRRNPGLKTKAPTFKSCVGFLDLYKTGFMMPAWTDFRVTTKSEGSIYLFDATTLDSDEPVEAQQHPKWQLGENNPAINGLLHLKFVSPWCVEEKTGVKLLWTAPTWNQYPTPIPSICPGITTHKYQDTMNLNTFWPKVDREYMIEAGAPMVHLIPLTDAKVEFKIHEVDESEFYKKTNRSYAMYNWSFHNAYQKGVKKMKEKEKKESKCPFGFK